MDDDMTEWEWENRCGGCSSKDDEIERLRAENASLVVRTEWLLDQWVVARAYGDLQRQQAVRLQALIDAWAATPSQHRTASAAERYLLAAASPKEAHRGGV